jgi:hypothetical protein
MLDGRIDTQGTIKDLRARGVLDSITRDETVHVKESSASSPISLADTKSDDVAASKSSEDKKKPRKLIEDEHREVGGVKWSIYNTYLEASYVLSMEFTRQMLTSHQMVWHMGNSGSFCYCQRSQCGLVNPEYIC